MIKYIICFKYNFFIKCKVIQNIVAILLASSIKSASIKHLKMFTLIKSDEHDGYKKL